MFHLTRCLPPSLLLKHVKPGNAQGLLSPVRHGSISVILLNKVENKGQEGDIVTVRGGFARNYLLPRKLAAYATEENLIKYASILGQKPGKGLKAKE